MKEDQQGCYADRRWHWGQESAHPGGLIRPQHPQVAYCEAHLEDAEADEAVTDHGARNS
jgi:hypothetical protein